MFLFTNIALKCKISEQSILYQAYPTNNKSIWPPSKVWNMFAKYYIYFCFFFNLIHQQKIFWKMYCFLKHIDCYKVFCKPKGIFLRMLKQCFNWKTKIRKVDGFMHARNTFAVERDLHTWCLTFQIGFSDYLPKIAPMQVVS